MKTGFIFAGQGQQFLDMGKDLVSKYPLAQEKYDIAQEILGYDLLNLNLESLNNTKFTQPALYVLNAVLADILKLHHIEAEVVAGLSLGEYNALLYSGVFSFSDGLKIIKERAYLMANAYSENETGMLACLKVDIDQVNELIKDSSLEICNINTPSQIVVGGFRDEVVRMRKVFKENKVLAIPLKVSTISHTSLLKDQSVTLHSILSNFEYNKPKVDFVNNLNGELQSDNFILSLSKHISHPTNLSKSISLMKELEVRRFIEVGPKGSISKFVKEIVNDDSIEILNVYDITSLEGVINGI